MPGMTIAAQLNTIFCGQTQTFQQGEEIVYVIDVAAENFGSQTGCGIPGRTVVFHVNSFTTSVLWNHTRMHYLQIGIRPIYLPLVTR